MSNEKEKVYCEACAKYLDRGGMYFTIWHYEKWEEGVTFKNGACYHRIRTDDTPTRQVKIYGDLNKLNANNDCPHYKVIPPNETPPEEPVEELKLPWWKVWR